MCVLGKGGTRGHADGGFPCKLAVQVFYAGVEHYGVKVPYDVVKAYEGVFRVVSEKEQRFSHRIFKS